MVSFLLTGEAQFLRFDFGRRKFKFKFALDQNYVGNTFAKLRVCALALQRNPARKRYVTRAWRPDLTSRDLPGHCIFAYFFYATRVGWALRMKLRAGIVSTRTVFIICPRILWEVISNSMICSFALIATAIRLPGTDTTFTSAPSRLQSVRMPLHFSLPTIHSMLFFSVSIFQSSLKDLQNFAATIP